MHENQPTRAGFGLKKGKIMDQENCSLPVINNEPCHAAIRMQTCPGIAACGCVNTAGIKHLTLRYENEARLRVIRARAEERERRDAFPSHFVDQSDPVFSVVRSVDATLDTLRGLMKNVKKAGRRNS